MSDTAQLVEQLRLQIQQQQEHMSHQGDQMQQRLEHQQNRRNGSWLLCKEWVSAKLLLTNVSYTYVHGV